MKFVQFTTELTPNNLQYLQFTVSCSSPGRITRRQSNDITQDVQLLTLQVQTIPQHTTEL